MFLKDFLKNRLILALGFVTTLMAGINIFWIIFRVDFNTPKLRFRHWSNLEGVSQFYTTSPSYFYFFILLALIVLVSAWFISYRVYGSFKPAAYGTFVLAQITLLANIFISDALFRL